jgi:hypothetical protein
VIEPKADWTERVRLDATKDLINGSLAVDEPEYCGLQ